ncbi:MAG: amidohydrolase family protein [Desulfococcaceae bacterium]
MSRNSYFDLAFTGARLIDGAGGSPIPDAVVVVRDGRIDTVGHQPPPDDVRVIDLAGRTLMPGLIDAHVHMANIEVDFDRTAALPPAVFVHRASRNLETALDLGFTTLRDAGGLDPSFREAVDLGLIRGPRLRLSITMLTQTGGHADKRGPWRETHPPRNSLGVYPSVCDGPDAVLRAARDLIRRGADQIKVMADGGVASPSDRPGHPQFTVSELSAAAEAARAAGTHVMAHAYSPAAIQNCLAAGIASIEHGNLLDFETAVRMADAGAVYVPTLSVFEILSREGAACGMSPFVLEKLRSVADRGAEAVAIARDAGATIGSGSDIIGPFQHLLGRELALKAAVLGPMAAIVSATRTNAEILGLGDRLGTVEVGKIADLIVVDGDPLEDVGLFERGRERVLMVLRDGRIFKDRWTGRNPDGAA